MPLDDARPAAPLGSWIRDNLGSAHRQPYEWAKSNPGLGEKLLMTLMGLSRAGPPSVSVSPIAPQMLARQQGLQPASQAPGALGGGKGYPQLRDPANVNHEPLAGWQNDLANELLMANQNRKLPWSMPRVDPLLDLLPPGGKQ